MTKDELIAWTDDINYETAKSKEAILLKIARAALQADKMGSVICQPMPCAESYVYYPVETELDEILKGIE